ncbi:MAG: peptidylprolyl isomerase [Bacteroidales bacterium]|nr:peptidylprolyl isomerase [Bacteroidales bacterium]
MKRIVGICLLFIYIGSSSAIFAQQPSDTLFLIDNTPVTVGEFYNLYLKNVNIQNSIPDSTLQSYMDLFVNFRLKVQAAKDLKIDTSKAFQNEYHSYVDQLAESYLIDSTTLNKLIDEAYQRLKVEVSASHILIAIPPSVDSKDTLKYYQKALETRNRLLNGEPFGKVALSTSNDPSVSRNNGYLGWFSAFQMVYPFENAAYNTPEDSISMPVRTRFGYHIIKVHGRRPSKGEIKIAHIMVRVQPNATPEEVENARKKILDLYKKVTSGEDFAAVARQESDDKASAKNGGEFPWVHSGQIIPEFEAVAFSLDHDGQISEPFQSQFGWHIIKRIAKKEVSTKEEMLPEIKKMISRDSRSSQMTAALINHLKKQYNFKANMVAVQQLVSYLDSSLYKGQWKIQPLKNNPTVIAFAGKQYTLNDFATYIETVQKTIGQKSISDFLNLSFSEYSNKLLVDYEKSLLPTIYPAYKELAQEYLQGMLLFEISNRIVWEPASDSAKIAEFYNAHKSNYKWGERLYYTIYTLKDTLLLNKLEKQRLSKKYAKLSPNEFAKEFEKKTKSTLTVEQKVGDISTPELSNYKSWKEPLSTHHTSNGIKIWEVNKITNGDIKDLNDCRGEVISDLQKDLETEWLQELKSKYKVTFNKKTLNEVKHSLCNISAQ